MTIRNNRTEISLALGEAVLDIVQKGHGKVRTSP